MIIEMHVKKGVSIELKPETPIEELVLRTMADATDKGTPMRVAKAADGAGFLFSVEG